MCVYACVLEKEQYIFSQLLLITIHLTSDWKEYIFKLLVVGAKLNQVSFPLKEIKLLLCKSVLMRTEPADIDKWE